MLVSSYLTPKARKGAAGRMLFLNHRGEPHAGFAGNLQRRFAPAGGPRGGG